MQFHAYLFFSGGQCREAFEHYRSVLGGELEMMAFSDLPPGEEAPVPADQADQVMHASLAIGEAMLLGSDDPTGDGGPKSGVAVHLTCDSDEEADRVFAALLDGGRVDMPMEQVFWASRFGMGADRFGVSWMVSTPAPAEVGAG
jgi:PhnB protein